MAWKKGQSGNPIGRLSEKSFADAVRMAVSEDDPVTKRRKLRVIADKLVAKAIEGESWAIAQVADRLDGKPAQESTVNVNNKHDPTDWTREELVAFLDDAAARGRGAAKANGRSDKPNQVH